MYGSQIVLHATNVHVGTGAKKLSFDVGFRLKVAEIADISTSL